MAFVRFIVLLFLASYSYSMGHQAGPLNAFGELVSVLFFIFGPAIYLLPTYEAWNRKHENLTSVALLNIFLGWTFLGWVAAMIWAFKRPVTVVAIATPVEGSLRPIQKNSKKCPFCAEDILVAAIKCKHCGSELTAM